MVQGIADVVLFGLFAVGIALMVLLGMVHYELGPAARLAGGKRWLLGVALGSGVLAFSFKLALIIALVNFPQYTIKPLLNTPSSVPVSRPTAVTFEPAYTWVSLPVQDDIEDEREQKISEVYVWQSLPDQAPSPVDNPQSEAKIALGRRLFFDPNLSLDRSVSCASCHDVDGLAGSDARATAIGVNGERGTRNAPSVWNAAFQSVLFWDGRAASLEQQASGPLLNPLEMAMPSLAAVEQRVLEQEQYRRAFATIYGSQQHIGFKHIAQVIAAYQRSLISNDTPYDRFVDGDPHALSAAQIRGMWLFQSLGCIHCHYGPNFSAASIFGAGMPLRIFPINPTPYEQRYALLDDNGAAAGDHGRGVWRVPSLRNVALTGPWLHNGSVTELSEAVRIMTATQLGYSGRHLRWSQRDRRLREINKPRVDSQSINDIVAFLHALSSDRLVATHKRLINTRF